MSTLFITETQRPNLRQSPDFKLDGGTFMELQRPRMDSSLALSCSGAGNEKGKERKDNQEGGTRRGSESVARLFSQG